MTKREQVGLVLFVKRIRMKNLEVIFPEHLWWQSVWGKNFETRELALLSRMSETSCQVSMACLMAEVKEGTRNGRVAPFRVLIASLVP